MKILKPTLLALTCALLLAFTNQFTQVTIESNQRHYEERVLREMVNGAALEKSASQQGRTTAHYLAAAQAADSQDAHERREYYLEQADSGGSKKHFLVELTRARMLLANGSRAAALHTEGVAHARSRTPGLTTTNPGCFAASVNRGSEA